jgi:hypothetical protein
LLAKNESNISFQNTNYTEKAKFMATTILGFNGRVSIAVRKVAEKYPSAKLYEVAAMATGGPTRDPAKIDRMTVVFLHPGDSIDSTDSAVTIESIGYSEFGEPKVIPVPFLGDLVVEWPVRMDLSEANKLKEEAGFSKPYTRVILRNPLGPKETNPFFIFNVAGESSCYILVDTVTSEVHIEDLSSHTPASLEEVAVE